MHPHLGACLCTVHDSVTAEHWEWVWDLLQSLLLKLILRRTPNINIHIIIAVDTPCCQSSSGSYRPAWGQLVQGTSKGATNGQGMRYYSRNTRYTHTVHPGGRGREKDRNGKLVHWVCSLLKLTSLFLSSVDWKCSFPSFSIPSLPCSHGSMEWYWSYRLLKFWKLIGVWVKCLS